MGKLGQISPISWSAAFSADLAGKNKVDAHPGIAKTQVKVIAATSDFSAFISSSPRDMGTAEFTRQFAFELPRYAGKTPVER